MNRRTALLAATIGACVAAGTGAAFGATAWTNSGTGSAAAKAMHLSPPAAANISTAAGSTSVMITVNAGPAAPSATASGYRVDRVSPTAKTGVCYIVASTGSCTDTGLTPANYSYSVFSVIGTNLNTTPVVSWTSASGTGVSAKVIATASSMSVSSITAGVVTNNGKTGIGSYLWGGTITIVVHDNLGANVSGATVSGGWTYTMNGSSQTGVGSPLTSCVTDSTGSCEVVYTNQMQVNVRSATFTVSNVAKTGLSYTLPSPAPSATLDEPTTHP